MVDPVLNFAKVTVSIGYNAAATSIALTAGHGASLPQPASVGAFNLVWWNSTDYPDPSDDPNREIVRCTARSTDTLTVTRAQESTSASTKNTSSKTYKMILSLTKKTIDDIATDSVAFSTIAVSGQTNVVALPFTETLTLAAGGSIVLTTDPENGKVTISTAAPSAFGIVVESLGGAVNGVNTTFTAYHTPVWITLNGQTLLAGEGWSIAGSTITFTDAPLTGDIIHNFYNDIIPTPVAGGNYYGFGAFTH